MKKNLRIIITYGKMSVEENCGIKLRSGKVVIPRKSYYDYSDSESDDDSHSYLCDSSDDEDTFIPPKTRTILDWGKVRESYDKFISSYSDESDSYDFVEGSVEKKTTSKVRVPSGYGDTVGDYLRKFIDCYQDCIIDHDQLHSLTYEFSEYLNRLPSKVSEKSAEIAEIFCLNACDYVLRKSRSEGGISRRQFMKLGMKFDIFSLIFGSNR